MQTRINFGHYWGNQLPPLQALKDAFFSNDANAWFKNGGNDSASITFQDIDNSGHSTLEDGRVDSSLQLVGHSKFGVFLFYDRTRWRRMASKGNMEDLKVFVRTLHDDLRPLAFFVPFDKAWLAVHDFISSGGQPSSAIEWIDMRELSGEIFPDPRHVPKPGERIIERSQG
jgi:hypothetical protein